MSDGGDTYERRVSRKYATKALDVPGIGALIASEAVLGGLSISAQQPTYEESVEWPADYVAVASAVAIVAAQCFDDPYAGMFRIRDPDIIEWDTDGTRWQSDMSAADKETILNTLLGTVKACGWMVDTTLLARQNRLRLIREPLPHTELR